MDNGRGVSRGGKGGHCTSTLYVGIVVEGVTEVGCGNDGPAVLFKHVSRGRKKTPYNYGSQLKQ